MAMSDVEIPGEDAQSSLYPQPSEPAELDLFAKAMLSRMRRQVFQVDCPVTKIGRFSVGAPIGQGGMGVVYSAVDEQLGRKIALKVVLADDGEPLERHQHRLLREAQAMARLSHPNVVQVYEAGTHEGLVFIAMELIRGETLAAWLRRESREWRAIMRVFCQAGRGLAAAHALDIIHRDFKPENVLIGEDGRVRVTDFGIARVLSASDDCNATDPDNDGATSEQTLTATGARPGTPVYMSPEQFSRGSITSRSDQFSFCVALFAALFGVRPFSGETWNELASAVSSGMVRDVRRGSVPRRVYKAIVRGLSVDPEQRFPAMEALLAALEPRSYLRVIAPVVLAIVGTSVLFPAIDHVANPPCDAQAQLAGVWDDSIQEELAHVFTEGEPVDGDALWQSTRSQLSLYTEQWQGAYRESCRAHNDDQFSERLYSLRVRCLDRRLEVFNRLTAELRDGRSSVLLRAPLAASKLEEIQSCTDHDTLLLGMDPPPPSFVDTVDELRTEISSARADEIVGLLESSETKARATIERALVVGYKPTLAEAHLQLGRVATLARKYEVAREALGRAGLLAVETGHDEVALESRTWLVAATIISENAPPEAEILLAEAEAWMVRYSGSPRQRAWLQVQRGLVYAAVGKSGEAEHELRGAIKQYQASSRPADLDLLIAREQLANTLVRTREPGAMAEALTLYRSVLKQRELLLGRSHPDQITVRFNLGATLAELGPEYYDEAQDLLKNALQLAQTRYGAEHLELADHHLGLAGLLFNRSKLEAATRHSEQALEIYDKHLSSIHPDRAYALNLVGALLSRQGANSEALARYREAHKIWNDSLPETELVGIAEVGIGLELIALGENFKGRSTLTHALHSLERTVGPTSPILAAPLSGLADVALALEAPCEARAHLARIRELSGVIDPYTANKIARITADFNSTQVTCQAEPASDKEIAQPK